MSAQLDRDALDAAVEELADHVRLRGRALFRYDRAAKAVITRYMEEANE